MKKAGLLSLLNVLTYSLVSILMPVFTVSGETLSSAKITEFLASNGEGIEDSNGKRSDWIELWNSTNGAGDLDGWYLTDDPENLTKWRIPAVILEV